jgi:hypothetical protein
MDVAAALLIATLTGIKNGTVRPDLSQWAILEEAGLAQGGTLTKAAWARLDQRRVGWATTYG